MIRGMNVYISGSTKNRHYGSHDADGFESVSNFAKHCAGREAKQQPDHSLLQLRSLINLSIFVTIAGV